MPQSLVKIYTHLVFSTKYRQPFITPDIETGLHNYMGGICNGLECPVVRVGGYLDHVHVLCGLSKKIALMDLLKVLKSRSSKWVKDNFPRYHNFYWQDGYGAFSVNPAEIDVVINYITNQHDHHSKQPFKTEYINLLE